MAVRVVCLGAVNLDLIYRVEDLSPFIEAVPGLTPGGEAALDAAAEERVQELLARQGRLMGKSGGGQAANTAFALARLGLPAVLVGRVGQDEDGRFLKESLVGVNLEYLRQAGESGRAYVLVDTGGERTILVAPNTNDELDEADVPWEVLEQADFVHFTSFVGEGPLRVQRRAARRLKKKNGPVLTLDPGELYARRGREGLEDLLARVETLLVTEAEWLALGGHLDCHPEWAPPYVLIKRGALGARLLMEGYYQDFPAEPPARLVDTLGAGDVFAAGYLAGRASGLKLAQAVLLAVKAAACSLAGTGREAYPDREFLERHLSRWR
ncbi:MAG: carbohydrate kinase family protein [Deltaproteobacteria bacterium]|nr:carbohydrate kinase family protein [Deltaproteobacteria bacterium]